MCASGDQMRPLLFAQKRSGETIPGQLVCGQSKSQPQRFTWKAANVDTMAAQLFGELDRFDMTGKAEERCPAEYSKAGTFQDGLEPWLIRPKTRGRLGEPTRVRERGLADPQSGA